MQPRFKPPTERQMQALQFIADRVRSGGIAPTFREIGDSMGIRSTNGVADHLHALERRGLIQRHDMLSRGVTLTETGRKLCGLESTSDTQRIHLLERLFGAVRSFADATKSHDVSRAYRDVLAIKVELEKITPSEGRAA